MAFYIMFYFSYLHVGAHSVYDQVGRGATYRMIVPKQVKIREHNCPRSLYVIITQHRKIVRRIKLLSKKRYDNDK
jgi:hypothetical protein